jgi:hypothetical protein
MRSTTARPAISQVAGDAQPSMPKKQQDQDEHTQGTVGMMRLLSGRSGAAGSAVFRGTAQTSRQVGAMRRASRDAPGPGQTTIRPASRASRA